MGEIEDLIRKIVKETIDSMSNIKKHDNILLFITGGAVNINEIFNTLSLEEGYSYKLVMSESAKNVIPDEFIKKLNADLITSKSEMTPIIKKTNTILIPVLTRNTLAKIAHGISDNLVTLGIQEALMMGKRIIAVKDSFDPKNSINISLGYTKNVVYNSMLNEYMKNAEDMGIEFISSSQIKETINKGTTDETNGKTSGMEITYGVITRSDILKLKEDKTIYIKEGSVVTPLAADYIKENGIKICYLK